MPVIYDYSLGNVRSSQTLYNCGPGSIVDLTTGSYMPMGLDYQEIRLNSLGPYKEVSKIREERLEKLLEVEHFQAPPTPGEDQIIDFGKKVNRNWALPVVRFPEWLECPGCHRLGKMNDPFESQADGRMLCIDCKREVNPVRFIVICPAGHIQDFPWIEYAHRNQKGFDRDTKHHLFLRSSGKSAALSDLFLECSDCPGLKEDMGDIYNKEAMRKWFPKCKGLRPWLGKEGKDKCTIKDIPFVSQRGGASVYFPVVTTMLSIPPASEAVAEHLRGSYPILSSMDENTRRHALEGFCTSKSISVNIALAWFDRYHAQQTGDGAQNETDARYEEYYALTMNHEEEPVVGVYPEFQTKTIEPTEAMKKWFDVFTSVERLREVRSLCGFTRVAPKTLPAEKIREAIAKREIAPLSYRRMLWLPGIEVRGEGIFLKFNQHEIDKWLNNSPEVISRAARINDIYEYFSVQKYGRERIYTITPQLLMLHAFSHMVIRRLSLDCGYSAASLKERLYISEPDDPNKMAGILIYTGSSDSDGSLGGLIHLAHPEKIEDIVRNAMGDASWCASDPVCAETDPELAGERFSGASCHSCMLLPETACERYNKDLDRVMLVGTPAGDIKGYFHDLI